MEPLSITAAFYGSSFRPSVYVISSLKATDGADLAVEPAETYLVGLYYTSKCPKVGDRRNPLFRPERLGPEVIATVKGKLLATLSDDLIRCPCCHRTNGR